MPRIGDRVPGGESGEAACSPRKRGALRDRCGFLLAADSYYRVFRRASCLIANDCGSGLASTALLRCKPRALRLPELVRRRSPSVIRNGIVWPSAPEGGHRQSLLCCTPAAITRVWTVLVLDISLSKSKPA